MTKKIKFINGEMYEYDLYSLVDRYDDILTQRSDPFVFEGENKTPIIGKTLAVSLLETMKHYHGVGLSANQVGIPLRVFVIGMPGEGNTATAYAFFNPEILETTGETKFAEGCLSFPGLYLPITRPETVSIRWQDMYGVTKEERFTGLTARVVLHEYDHMEGIVFTSLVPSLILDKAKSKVKSNNKKLKKQYEDEAKQELIKQAMNNVAKNLKESNTQ